MKRPPVEALAALALVFALVMLCLLAGKAAATTVSQAGAYYAGSRPAEAPVFASLEGVAEAFWTPRSVALPVPVEVDLAPEASLEAGGRGAIGSPVVWIAENEVPVGGIGWEARWSRLLILCGTYLHERGHNAGLDHDAPYAIMGSEASGPPPRCESWAYRQVGR